MSLIAVNDEIVAVAQGSFIHCYNQSYDTYSQIAAQSNPLNQESVVDIVVSPDNKLLGVLHLKKIILYELPDLKSVEEFVLPRSASKIRFDNNSKIIFVADKTGDVLLFEILKQDKGSKILGHLSLLLNVLQTDDGKYIISSDRDEKIRVSHYPNSYNIQTFCLGHKEFVLHIELLPFTNFLTSASGDGTVKIWNYISGKLKHTIDTCNDVHDYESLKNTFCKMMNEEVINSLPIVHYSITNLSALSYLIAVTVHSYNKILIYKLTLHNVGFSHNIVMQLPIEHLPTSLKFNKLSLFIYNGLQSQVLQYETIIDSDKISFNLKKQLKVFENVITDTEDSDSDNNNPNNFIRQLFKRKFDNVQEYQTRKKMRMQKATG